jgi:hypothetical protein
MFRPSASMMYSSAMSMMRTHELPNCAAKNGNTSSTDASSTAMLL